MCGIVGYVGKRNATPLLLEALKRLEYRGYDSCGVGVIADKNGRIYLRKTSGKIQDLRTLLQKKEMPSGSTGISHTRWATHGKPNTVNAHPHASNLGNLLIVHNGIIENYQTLKKALYQKGYRFVSQTDSEVIAHLVSSFNQGDLLKAVQRAMKQLKGSYAIGVISRDHPQQIIAARRGSPLIVGVGEGENFIASDVPAILHHTRKIIYLNDGEIAQISSQRVNIFDVNGLPIRPKIQKVTFQLDAAEKQGFDHFMLKEIVEQPSVLSGIFSFYIKKKHIVLDGLNLSDLALRRFRHIVIVACGTAFHAGLVGKYVIEQVAGVPVSVDVSSEFRYRSLIIDSSTLVIAVSQSGETADTLAAVREAKNKKAKVISICNVVGSSLARESDGVVYTHAGPEIGVASTKAYTAQLAIFYLLALKFSLVHRKISDMKAQTLIKDLKCVPGVLRDFLKTKQIIAKIARANSHFGCFLFLGRNINFPSALEGALKLKEISYIPAEGYAAGEMKHGPIALIDEYRAVVCVAPESDVYEKMISNMQEIRARKGKIIAVATQGDLGIKQHAHHVIYVPRVNKILTPLVAVVPLQLLAYYIAVERGNDVDQPRNLAKSVTVE